MKFWLGLHMPSMLERTDVPACISYAQLRGKKRLPKPLGTIFLDSDGFGCVSKNGRYTFSAATYARFVRRCRDEWGPLLRHASIMDWMCEPGVIHGDAERGWPGTHMTVGQHQTLTVNSWLSLNAEDGSLPWVPVLQGYTVDEYHACADLYEQHTCTRLAELPLVGVGSVCRRQGMQEAATIIKSLYARGLHNLHGFGFKITGLVSKNLRLCNVLASADSMAWSKRARNAWRHDKKRLCGGDHRGSCSNCLTWALIWRERLVKRMERAAQLGTQTAIF